MQCKRKEATLRSDQKWPRAVSHGQEWSEAVIPTVLHHGPAGVQEERGLRVRAVTEPTGSPLGLSLSTIRAGFLWKGGQGNSPSIIPALCCTDSFLYLCLRPSLSPVPGTPLSVGKVRRRWLGGWKTVVLFHLVSGLQQGLVVSLLHCWTRTHLVHLLLGKSLSLS